MNHELRRKIIEKYGSQVRFAFELGEPETVVSKIVRGWREVSHERQKAWAKALGCEVKDIFWR